ncbi:MAG: hypothetical protein JWO45_1551 [Spartobacteria bacterium]|nr:hypothetical protein [Spartobacteria bacterium]
MNSPGEKRWKFSAWTLGLILVLAALLRVYKLDGQLWLDEVVALVHSYRAPVWTILTKFPGHFPHPLYEQLAHVSLVLFGESAFAIRLPAAIFGVGGIMMFYKLSRRISGNGDGEALLGAGLLAVSYHHIYYSQDARGYTLYLALALAATDRLLVLLDRMRWRTAMTYAILAALAAFAQTAGLTLALGQILVALLWARRGSPSRAGNAPTSRQLLGILGLCLCLILLLYSPIIADSISYTALTAGHEVPAATSGRVRDLLVELVWGVAPTFSAAVFFIVGVTICVIGGWDLYRRTPVALALMIMPVMISLGVMAAVRAAMHPRYSLLLLMTAYLMAARGLVILGQRFLPRRAGWIRPSIAVLIVVLTALPLVSYYSMPKQDFLGAIREVRAAAAPSERTGVLDLVGVFKSIYPLPEFPVINKLPELLREEAHGKGVWIVTTLERVEAKRRPDLLARLRDQYLLVRTLPASTGDCEMRIYHRPPVVPNQSGEPIP